MTSSRCETASIHEASHITLVAHMQQKHTRMHSLAAARLTFSMLFCKQAEAVDISKLTKGVMSL